VQEQKYAPDPQVVRRQGMLRKLVSIASCLLRYSKSNKKTVISLGIAVSHLKVSFPDYYLSDGKMIINQEQYVDHLELMAEIAPKVCKIEVAVNTADQNSKEQRLLRFLEPRLKYIADAVQENLDNKVLI
jgi:hypothetical protein